MILVNIGHKLVRHIDSADISTGYASRLWMRLPFQRINQPLLESRWGLWSRTLRYEREDVVRQCHVELIDTYYNVHVECYGALSTERIIVTLTRNASTRFGELHVGEDPGYLQSCAFSRGRVHTERDD